MIDVERALERPSVEFLGWFIAFIVFVYRIEVPSIGLRLSRLLFAEVRPLEDHRERIAEDNSCLEIIISVGRERAKYTI